MRPHAVQRRSAAQAALGDDGESRVVDFLQALRVEFLPLRGASGRPAPQPEPASPLVTGLTFRDTARNGEYIVVTEVVRSRNAVISVIDR